MSLLDDISGRASRWLDNVAAALLALRERMRPPRFARLVEDESGAFALEQAPAAGSDAGRRKTGRKSGGDGAAPEGGRVRLAGGAADADDARALAPMLARARVELILLPGHFLFRPLQLPRRASDFLDGIVRAQIDRLTPWGPAEAAFGCRPAGDVGSERLQVTVAATSKRLLAPYIEAIRGFGVDAIAISTTAPGEPGASIKVFEQKLGSALDIGRLKRILTAALVALGLLCAGSLVTSSFISNELDSRIQELNGKIAARRAALHRTDDASGAAAAALRERKNAAPSVVLVYDELSRVLPDDAYLTELRIQGDKAQITGIARDAPSLIRLIEQSPRFKHATFFAPTTRSPGDAGQHFSIETHIEPGLSRAAARP